MIDHPSQQRSPMPGRLHLFKVVCLSLFTCSAVGFAPHAADPTKRLWRHIAAVTVKPSTPPSFATSIRRYALSSASSGINERFPRLSAEEEKELLRQAVEYRRLDRLEKELALKSPTKSIPLLSVRAKVAGYGDDLDLYEDFKFQGQKARETLVTRNMGLVHYCVNNIVGKDFTNVKKGNSKTKHSRVPNGKLPLNSLSREDLIQEGAIGLARAVDKWDPAIGGKFSTYAVYWVRAAILRCIAERDDMMRVPSHVSQAVQKINKAANKLGIELGTSGSILESVNGNNKWKEAHAAKKLAEEAGLSEGNFQVAMKVRSRRYSGGYVQFESWMEKGRNLERDASNLVGVKEESELESSAATEQLRSVLSEFLHPNEMEALSWRYGLLQDQDETPEERANRQFLEMEEQLFGNSPMSATTTAESVNARQKEYFKPSAIPTAKGRWGEAMTFTEVGKRMEVSAEYTRKLCKRAIDKLRQAAEDGKLETALLY
jgi:RNA polymerase sigma factor (sigma-70 family)